MTNTKMNYVQALDIAINALRDVEGDCVDKLIALRTSIEKRNRRKPMMTNEQKAIANEKRKQNAKIKREQFVAPIIPILRDALTAPMTAKSLYEKVKDALPTDVTTGKVQAILMKEMSQEVRKIDNGRNAFLYERI